MQSNILPLLAALLPHCIRAAEQKAPTQSHPTPKRPRRAAPGPLPEIFAPFEIRGRRECRALARPQPRMQVEKAYERSHHRSAANDPALPARLVLTGSFVLSPAIGLVVTVVRVMRSIIARSQRREIRTTRLHRPRAARSVLRATSVHRIPHPTSVTIAIRPSCGRGMAGVVGVIWGEREAEYFYVEGWTGFY